MVFDRLVDDIAHANRGRQVKNDVALADEAVDHMDVADVLDGVAEVGIGHEAFNVAQTPGRQVVNDGDQVAARQQPLGQMTADEAGPAGD